VTRIPVIDFRTLDQLLKKLALCGFGSGAATFSTNLASTSASTRHSDLSTKRPHVS